MLLRARRVLDGGGAIDDVLAAGDNGLINSIANDHQILHRRRDLNLFVVGTSLHIYDKPRRSAPLRRSSHGLRNSLIVTRPILRHHKVSVHRRRLKKLPVRSRNPGREHAFSIVGEQLPVPPS
ncbi:hypothetical protein IEQ34_004101 [Dendrobium chrysotoxum]|uniref:Uncharacterized protein n=1 Tax=Dendrobium chrysotoxum TaxID=161865 RepID=A0AAV7HH91_DENCH|nr:hypothetical protein IEQ34_004101 [Dendrobium chrysotoxum]